MSHVVVPGTKERDLIRVFVDVIRDLERRRSPWIIWVASESNDKCPMRHTGYLTEKKTQTHRGESDMKMEAEIGAMWLVTNKEAKERLRPTEAGRGKELLPWRLWGRCALTL